MYISSVSPVNQKVNSFGAHFTNVDIGASSINGSLKISAVDDKSGEIIAKDRLTVFDKGEKRSEEGFEANVAKKVADFEKKHEKEILSHDKDNETMLTVCYPGPCVRYGDGNGFFLSNFFYDDNKTHRFERPINPDAIDKNLRNNGVTLLQSRHANDMAGAGACLLNKLQQQHPEVLQEGEEILFMYPGGGLGSGVFSVEKDEVKLRPSELQHMKRYGTDNESAEMSVGAGFLRRNFEKALGLEENAIGENTMAVDNYDELKATVGHDVDKTDFEKASKEAILTFMDSLGQLIATKVCESKLHTVILTGPIVKSLRSSVNNNPQFEDKTSEKEPDNFKATLKEKVQDNLTDVGKKILGEPDNLNILFLTTKDNTEGAHLLQKGVAVGNPPSWYNIAK
ncbi:hypothetical protein II906_09785 [bacterium]|nr:hypothetical protein [bacterium]